MMDDTTKDLDALLAGVRAGDADAATSLVEHLYPVVMAVVHRRRPATTAPEDMAQEVFLKLFTGLPRFRGGGGSLEAWARRVAFTTCLNQLRHEARRPELRWSDLTPDQTACLEPLPEGGASGGAQDRAAARELVAALLGQLPAADRLLLELMDLEERPMTEICRLTGWSAVNVRVRCFRARRRLRAALGKLLTEHERS
jgi:RNA polymerase sigma-70 factor (ECF subfamily)